MTVTSVAVAKTKFLFDMHDCTVGSDVGKGDFRSCWGFCTCVDTCTCDRTCLHTWTWSICFAMILRLSNLDCSLYEVTTNGSQEALASPE